MTTVLNARIFSIDPEPKIRTLWDGQLYQFDVFGIPKGDPNKERALDFIKFATGQKEQTDLLLTTASGIDPSRKSTLYSDAYKKFAPKVQNVLAGALENGLSWPTGPDSPQLQQTLADNLALILSGDKSPEQAIADTHKSWIGIIGA